MLTPPETFKQLRALTVSAPLLLAFGWGFMLWTHGLRPSELVMGLVGLVCLSAVLLVQPLIWTSPWGTHMVIRTCVGAVVAFVLPWSIMLAPMISLGSAPPWALSAILVALHCTALVVAAVWHARQATLQTGAKVLKWPGIDIDLRQRVIRKRWEETSLATQIASPALIGGASVILYHALKAWVPEQGMILIAVLLASGIGLWLEVGPLGRALGQAWRLRSLERQDGGRPFASDRLGWLTTERQRSPIGRWWARRTQT